jgi:hypothetical protein
MGKWTVRDGVDELFIVESLTDGRVSLRIPPADPLVVTRAGAEQIRMFIGAAISDVSSGSSS